MLVGVLLLLGVSGTGELRRISLTVQSAGAHDESFGCRAGVIKGITGDQRQQLTRGRLQNPRLVRKDNIGESDTVEVLPSRNRNSDEIAGLEFTQTPKEGIAVRSKGYIARLSWQCGPRNMSNGYSKYWRPRPFSHHG